MLGHSHNGSSAGNKSWALAGLGTNYSLQPYPDTLHRGYGWGRMVDLDDPFPSRAKTIHSDFHSEAKGLARSAKDTRKTTYPLQWK
jgi:hypothetical protein